MSGGAAALEIGRLDPRLLPTLTALFGATFPWRAAWLTEADSDGRHSLCVDPPWSFADRQRWQRALDLLLEQPFARDQGVYLREVRDRRGTRTEMAYPMPPENYSGGAWLVGPFPSAAAADAWATEALAPGWVHDHHEHAGRNFADVFFGDPDGPPPS